MVALQYAMVARYDTVVVIISPRLTTRVPGGPRAYTGRSICVRIAQSVGEKGGPCQSSRSMFVMSFCKASTSGISSTSLKHEGVAEATFRSRRLAIHIIVTIVKALKRWAA